MGITDFLFGKKKSNLVALTELGRHKSEQIAGSQGLKLKVISYLEEHDASSIGEISSGISYPQEQVKQMVAKLYRDQWVTFVKNAGLD